MESWRSHPRYEGLFEVSSLGRVRGVDREITSSNGQVRKWKGRTRKTYINPANGYEALNPTKKGGNEYVHRLVCEAFHGLPPFEHAVVRHLDGDKTNNTPDNLAWGTHSDNAYDDVTNGTHHYSSRTHCKNGHEYTLENTKIPKHGSGRVCRACERAAINRWNKKKREEGLPEGDPRHGTTTAFASYMCRCEICVNAKREYERAARERRQALNATLRKVN